MRICNNKYLGVITDNKLLQKLQKNDLCGKFSQACGIVYELCVIIVFGAPATALPIANISNCSICIL